MRIRRSFLLGAGGALLCSLGAALFLGWRHVERRVSEATAPDRLLSARIRPLSFRAAAAPRDAGWNVTGDGAVLSAAAVSGELWTGGGSGLASKHSSLDTRQGLPSLRVSAVASWRGTLAFACERGGWGRVGPAGSGIEEAVTGWGILQVRTLVETEAGELLVGARQGLFRAAHGAGELELLDPGPVRAIATLPGGAVAAGGETGLRLVFTSGLPARPLETPDPWIDALGVLGGKLWAVTAAGAAAGPLDGSAPLVLQPRGRDLLSGVAWDNGFRALPEGDAPRVATLLPDGSRREEATPERFTRLLAAGGSLLADGPSGLYLRAEGGWTLVRPRPPASLPKGHVNALAADASGVWAGFFSGGVSRREGRSASARWTNVTGSSAWGVNALLPAGGALYAATLRGAYRVDGNRATSLEGAGSAFALASTRAGIVVGYAQGVYLPGRRLLSAFHGLPGNQALALAPSGEALWVGTPTGLGRIAGSRVTGRVVAGEGKLPHPWITALLPREDALLVATYGGGLARRTGEGRDERWERLPGTEGLKVNAGALVAGPDGRVYVGTQGRGVYRSDPFVRQLEPLALPLPSPDVFGFAFFPPGNPDTLLVATSEGLLSLPLAPNTEAP